MTINTARVRDVLAAVTLITLMMSCAVQPQDEKDDGEHNHPKQVSIRSPTL